VRFDGQEDKRSQRDAIRWPVLERAADFSRIGALSDAGSWPELWVGSTRSVAAQPFEELLPPPPALSFHHFRYDAKQIVTITAYQTSHHDPSQPAFAPTQPDRAPNPWSHPSRWKTAVRLNAFCHRARIEVVGLGRLGASTSAPRSSMAAWPCSASSPCWRHRIRSRWRSLSPRPARNRLKRADTAVFPDLLESPLDPLQQSSRNRLGCLRLFFMGYPQARAADRCASTAGQVLAPVPTVALAALALAEVGLAGAPGGSTLCGAVAAAPACLRPVPIRSRLLLQRLGPLAGSSRPDLAPFRSLPTL